MILIFLIIVKLYLLILFKFFNKTKKNRSFIYLKQKLKNGNFGFINNHKLNNLIININKHNENNFKLYFGSNGLGFYKKSNNCKIKIANNSVNVKCIKTSEITVVLYALKNSNSYKVNNFGVTFKTGKVQFNKHCKTQIKNEYVKLIKTVNDKNLCLGYTNNISTMKNSIKQHKKANFGIINAKQFSVDLLNNIVKIPNKNFNKNIFKFKVFSVKKFSNYYLVNKKYYVIKYNNNLYISTNLITNLNSFNSSIKPFFNIRIYVNNNIVNNKINNLLPQKIYFEYKSQFCFQPFLTWLNLNKKNANSYVFEYYNILSYYGINNFYNNKLFLSNPSFANKMVLFKVSNSQIIIKNNNGKYSALYNGIEYNNINYLTLNNTKTFVKKTALW